MKIKDKVWVLVADGGKALVLKNIGTPMTPDFQVVRQARLSTPPTRMMGRDRPGRRLDGSAPHRSSMEAPDLHERAEERFLSEQLDALERDKASNRFASLVVVAPPVALGRIRKSLGRRLASAIIATFDKGIAHMKPRQIADAVRAFPEPA